MEIDEKVIEDIEETTGTEVDIDKQEDKEEQFTNIAAEQERILSTLQHLEASKLYLSSEGVGSFLTGLANFVRRRLLDLRYVFTTNINGRDISKFSFSANTQQLWDLYKYNRSTLSKVQYSRVSSYETPITPGMKVTLPELASNLQKYLSPIKNEPNIWLKDLHMYISVIRSDADRRTATQPVPAMQEPLVLNKQLLTGLKEVIDPNGKEDKAKIERVIPNISCIEDIVGDLLNIAKKGNISYLKELKYQITEVCNSIDDLIATDKNIQDFQISKQVVNKILEDCENLANLVTTLVSYLTLYNNTISITRRLIEGLVDLESRT